MKKFEVGDKVLLEFWERDYRKGVIIKATPKQYKIQITNETNAKVFTRTHSLSSGVLLVPDTDEGRRRVANLLACINRRDAASREFSNQISNLRDKAGETE